jgi:hypothetical protein
MSLPRKLALALVSITLLLLGGRWACHALASDETKIRWLVEDMVDGFNDCKNGRVVGALAPDFRDRATGATRDDIHAALAQLFFERIDSRTHEFQLSAELVADELSVEVEHSEPARATARVHVLIDERSSDGKRLLYWDAHVTGRLERRDDGWRWIETTEVNHRDRRGAR